MKVPTPHPVRTVLVLVMTIPACGAWIGDDSPTFKAESDRDSKEFITCVGTAILKAARSSPKKIELVHFEYSKPKPDRSELAIKMQYSGAVTRIKYSVDILVYLDTSDKEKWEVLNIRYKDNNKSPVPYSEKKVQEAIKKFNR